MSDDASTIENAQAEVKRLESVMLEAGTLGDLQVMMNTANQLEAAQKKLKESLASVRKVANREDEVRLRVAIGDLVSGMMSEWEDRNQTKVTSVIWYVDDSKTDPNTGEPVPTIGLDINKRAIRTTGSTSIQGPRSLGRTHQRIGSRLLREHGLNCAKGYFSKTGVPYHKPDNFPAALFDTNGFFIINDEDSMLSNPYINVGKQVSIPRGIDSIPGYTKCPHEHA